MMEQDSKLLKLIEQCQKLINYMKFMANLVLIFLYLQNHFFAIISTPALTPKVNAIAGGCQLILFLVSIYFEGNSFSETTTKLKKNIFNDWNSMLYMLVPPFLLVLSWEVYHISAMILPYETAIAKNYTIISTVFFSILILRKGFFMTQILSLFFIAVGSSLFPQNYEFSEFKILSAYDNESRQIIGYSLIVLSTVFYGLSYILLELRLKSPENSFWITGIQFNIFYVPFFLIVSLINDYIFYDDSEFFDAFDIFAWFYIIFISAQKIMELFVLKISDSIHMQMSSAIALSLIVFLEQNFTLSRYGTGLIVYGTMLYSVLEFFPEWGILKRYQENHYREANCKEVYASFLQNKPAYEPTSNQN